MDMNPPLVDAVTTLHQGWRRRVDRWHRLAQRLPTLRPDAAHRALIGVLDDLDRHLLPYMELEEHLLEADGDTQVLDLEHATIRRSLRRLRAVNTAQPFDVHAAQAALSSICTVLLDHLRHERTAYLPAVGTRRGLRARQS